MSTYLEKANNYWGKVNKKPLTEEELYEMMRLDMEYSASIPDTKQYKMDFLYRMVKKYDGLEQQRKWLEIIEQLKQQYPMIHKESK